MKKVLKIFGIILLVLLIAIATAWFGFLKPEPPPISAEDRAAIHLMPLPAELKLGNGMFLLDERIAPPICPLHNMFKSFLNLKQRIK